MKNIPIFFAAVLSQSVWAMPTMPDNIEQVGSVVRVLDAPMTMTDDSPRSRWNPQSTPQSSSLKGVKKYYSEWLSFMAWRKWVNSFFAHDADAVLETSCHSNAAKFQAQCHLRTALKSKNIDALDAATERISKYLNSHTLFEETAETSQEFAEEAMKANEIGIIIHLLEQGAHLSDEQIQWAKQNFDLDRVFKEYCPSQAAVQAISLNIRPLEIVQAAFKYHSHDYFGMDQVIKLTQDRLMDEDDRKIIAEFRNKNDALLDGALVADYFKKSPPKIFHMADRGWKAETKELILKYLKQGKGIDAIMKHSENWKVKELIIKTFQSIKLDQKHTEEVQSYFSTLEQLYEALRNRRNYAVHYITKGLLQRKMHKPLEIFKYIAEKDRDLARAFKSAFLNMAQKYLGERDYEELLESVESTDLESDNDEDEVWQQ